MKTEQFLNFNGKNLILLSKDGIYWVAIKPICEVLNVEYTRQFKNLKNDEILASELAIQPIQVPGDQLRNYICLPEKYIYGWIFSINSESKELKEYKKECYNILYNHFHGTITGRKKLLTKRIDIQTQIYNLKEELKENEYYQELVQLEKESKAIAKDLKINDVEILEQPTLFG